MHIPSLSRMNGWMSFACCALARILFMLASSIEPPTKPFSSPEEVYTALETWMILFPVVFE